MSRTTTDTTVMFAENDLPGLLDMLRYDACTVISWSRVERDNGRGEVFQLRLRSAPGRTPGFEFTTERWASFGLYLKDDPRG